LQGAKQNIAKHYDISMKLYEQMLGPTMQRLVKPQDSHNQTTGTRCPPQFDLSFDE
jgi:cyclopropane fatty-acyl-phospholipid synthase-like methyltransferase